MKAPQLPTLSPSIRLIEPAIERDAPLSVTWLEGPNGHETLQLMGVADKDNKPTSLKKEQVRVQDFIERNDQLNWMIEVDRRVVGSIWVDLEPSSTLPSPAIHIMIGDSEFRGRGIGDTVTKAVIGYLHDQGNNHIYSRHLVSNEASAKLFTNNGFKAYGEQYTDTDGLTWQNIQLVFTN